MFPTRLVLPDGRNRDIHRNIGLDFAIGSVIRKGQISEWPELGNWEVEDIWIGDNCVTVQLK